MRIGLTGEKRVVNLIENLPQSVRNLLAVHSLECIPCKDGSYAVFTKYALHWLCNLTLKYSETQMLEMIEWSLKKKAQKEAE